MPGDFKSGTSMLKFKPSYFFRRFYHALYLKPSRASHINNHIDCRLDAFPCNQFLPLHSLLPSHAFIIVTGNQHNPLIASKLISLYGFLSRPDLSTRVFDSVHFKDPFLWNSIIKSYFSNGCYRKALDFFLGMRFSNCPPNNFTFPMAVTACAELGALDYGHMIHGLVVRLGHVGKNSAIGSSFIYMYAKCGRIGDAYLVFDEMPTTDVVAWTALIIGYLQNGESAKGLACLFEMHRIGEKPNDRTLEGGFLACGNLGALTEGKCLHGLAIKSGYWFCQDIQSSLLSMYSKYGTPEEACRSFCEVEVKDLICWTLIIAAYARLGCVTECLGLFWKMQECGIYPDEIVISCVLSSFNDSVWICEGKAFHGLIERRDFVQNQVVHRALIAMYCNLGMVAAAEQIFRRFRDMNPETWNLMVFEYGKGGLARKCVVLFQEMMHQGIECNACSLISVISSCSQLGTTFLGKSLHCYVIKCLLDDNISISNSLIGMYGKFGMLILAKRIFGRMRGDTVTWNTLISAYARSEELLETITLFDEMILEGLSPNSATLVSVLSACSCLASLEKGMKMHNYIRKMGIELNISLATALVDMYGKCGQLEKSRQIFDLMVERDIIAWNVMISCYGMHGDARSAIELFKQMEESNVRPNALTFLAVLSACRHGGFTEEGRFFFRKMQNYSVSPTLKHYACIIHLLGKSGNLQEAEDVVLSMPIRPDGGIWGALLSACKIYDEIEIGIRIAKYAIEANPENDGYYISISNMLNSAGKWEEAEKFREIMKERGVSKQLGWSTL